MNRYDLNGAIWAGLERLPAANLVPLIDDYVQATLVLLSRMRRYAAEGDPVRVSYLIHRFKSGSVALGVQDVVRVCDAYEDGSCSGTREELTAWVEKLELAFGRAMYLLDEKRADLAQGKQAI